MNTNNKSFSPRRRQLLCAVGGGALTMSPLVNAAVAGTSDGRLRVGIVLPPSTRYPELSRQILAGFQSFAATPAGRSLELLPIAVRSGPRESLVAAEKAVRSGRVDVLAGMIGRHTASSLAPVLENRGVPFVICDMGADIVREQSDSAFLVRSSLGYWQSNFAMGQWAAQNLGTRVLIATDFLESGHDMIYAFRRAFQDAGGETLDVQVTELPNESKGFSKVGRAIRSQRPDFVYAFYSGKRAEAFTRYYDEEGLARVAPLAGTALLTDAAISQRAIGAGSHGITTVSPWAPDRESPEIAALQSAYRDVSGGDPGLFALLGYETAHRIAAGFESAQGSKTGLNLASALSEASFAGPRGIVTPHAGMAEASAPVYVRRVSRSAEGLKNVTLAQLPAVQVDPQLGRELRTMIKSGWAHAYLAA